MIREGELKFMKYRFVYRHRKFTLLLLCSSFGKGKTNQFVSSFWDPLKRKFTMLSLFTINKAPETSAINNLK